MSTHPLRTPVLRAGLVLAASTVIFSDPRPAVADAEPIPELQRALREADRARAFADPVGIVEQHHALAALRQIDRQRQTHRPGADHDDRILCDVGARPLLVVVTAIAELGFGLCRIG